MGCKPLYGNMPALRNVFTYAGMLLGQTEKHLPLKRLTIITAPDI